MRAYASSGRNQPEVFKKGMSAFPEAIIFDMDDTLAATSALWKQAERHLLSVLGHEWSPELALQYKGMNVLDVAATIHRIVQPSVSLKDCQETLRAALFRAFREMPPDPMPGAVGCARRMGRIAPMVLASGSPLPLIEHVLDNLGLATEFSHVLSSESVKRGKPFPDVFLAAAALVGADPRMCVVFEDSLVGVQAAKAAGMICFAIPSSEASEIVRLADRSFQSLEEVEGLV